MPSQVSSLLSQFDEFIERRTRLCEAAAAAVQASERASEPPPEQARSLAQQPLLHGSEHPSDTSAVAVGWTAGEQSEPSPSGSRIERLPDLSRGGRASKMAHTWACQAGAKKAAPVNEAVALELDKLAELYKSRGREQQWRTYAYSKAAKILRGLTFEVRCELSCARDRALPALSLFLMRQIFLSSGLLTLFGCSL